MTLLNETRWNNIYDVRHESSDPLPLIQIPQPFYRHTIRIHCETFSDIPDGFYRGGYLTHRLNDFTNAVPWQAENLIVPINRIQLIRLQNLTNQFWLEFQPLRKWLWVNLKIDYFEDEP